MHDIVALAKQREENMRMGKVAVVILVSLCVTLFTVPQARATGVLKRFPIDFQLKLPDGTASNLLFTLERRPAAAYIRVWSETGSVAVKGRAAKYLYGARKSLADVLFTEQLWAGVYRGKTLLARVPVPLVPYALNSLNAGPPGPPGAGAVNVFDASDQYLGYSMPPDWLYVPSLKVFVRLNSYDGTFMAQQSLYFETDDCSGKAYVSPQDMGRLVVSSGKFYAGLRSAPIQITYGSRRQYGTCDDFPNAPDIAFEAVEITLPFNVPVAIPLRYE